MASRRRFRWQFLVLGLIAVLLVAWVVFHHPHAKPAAQRAVPVTVAAVTSEDIPVSITALGAAQAWTSDTIFSQVSGKLIRVNFTEGTYVRAGQLLAQVDPAPYQAALTQAEGTLRRDQALLAGARVDLARYQTLARQDSIARQTYDDQAALVKQDDGTVLLDQGAVAAARVNLAWTRITSPITGRAGVRMVDAGNLVSAGGSQGSAPATSAATNNTAPGSQSGTGIVIINQIEPMAVTFTVPQGDFQRLSDLTGAFRRPLAVTAYSQETGATTGSGVLSIADNRIDPSTGTVELKARFPNAGEKLWPGQFINVRLALQTLRNVTTIPVTAVNRGPNGEFVFVVLANNKVRQQPISVSLTQGSTAVISAGVKPGQIVVTDGQMILKAGSMVRIVRPQPPERPGP